MDQCKIQVDTRWPRKVPIFWPYVAQSRQSYPWAELRRLLWGACLRIGKRRCLLSVCSHRKIQATPNLGAQESRLYAFYSIFVCTKGILWMTLSAHQSSIYLTRCILACTKVWRIVNATLCEHSSLRSTPSQLLKLFNLLFHLIPNFWHCLSF